MPFTTIPFSTWYRKGERGNGWKRDYDLGKRVGNRDRNRSRLEKPKPLKVCMYLWV